MSVNHTVATTGAAVNSIVGNKKRHLNEQRSIHRNCLGLVPSHKIGLVPNDDDEHDSKSYRHHSTTHHEDGNDNDFDLLWTCRKRRKLSIDSILSSSSSSLLNDASEHSTSNEDTLDNNSWGSVSHSSGRLGLSSSSRRTLAAGDALQKAIELAMR